MDIDSAVGVSLVAQSEMNNKEKINMRLAEPRVCQGRIVLTSPFKASHSDAVFIFVSFARSKRAVTKTKSRTGGNHNGMNNLTG